MKSLSVNIQMKATEQDVPALLVILLYKIIVSIIVVFESVHE